MNVQKPVGPNRDQNQIRFIKIFDTIQGEGPFAGRPARFLRLAGCNLQCLLCDTDYTTDETTGTVGTLAKVLTTNLKNIELIVITGGEPTRQAALGKLVQQIRETQAAHIQIETNGAFEIDIHPRAFIEDVTLVCSPKTPKVNKNILPYIDFWKYVVGVNAIDDSDGLPIAALGTACRVARPPATTPKSSIFINPLDCGDPEENVANVSLATSICMRHGYRLGVQLHKLPGIELE